MFQYGDLRGDLLYVAELAKFLSKQYNEPVCRYCFMAVDYYSKAK